MTCLLFIRSQGFFFPSFFFVQECVKPVKVNKTTSSKGSAGTVKIHDDGTYVQLNEV